jgi:hypothetical protein
VVRVLANLYTEDLLEPQPNQVDRCSDHEARQGDAFPAIIRYVRGHEADEKASSVECWITTDAVDSNAV